LVHFSLKLNFLYLLEHCTYECRTGPATATMLQPSTSWQLCHSTFLPYTIMSDKTGWQNLTTNYFNKLKTIEYASDWEALIQALQVHQPPPFPPSHRKPEEWLTATQPIYATEVLAKVHGHNIYHFPGELVQFGTSDGNSKMEHFVNHCFLCNIIA
jgi:hypothetical protein